MALMIDKYGAIVEDVHGETDALKKAIELLSGRVSFLESKIENIIDTIVYNNPVPTKKSRKK